MGNSFSAPGPLAQDTDFDAFWYQDVNIGVVRVAASLEKELYEQMSKSGIGISPYKNDVDIRSGSTFHTPLSRRVAICDQTVIRAFIENRCGNMDKARAKKYTEDFQTLVDMPQIALFTLKSRLPTSYSSVKRCFVGPECKENFCRQLSDQLVFCKECYTRPILFNVRKDEFEMKRHLERHQQNGNSHKALSKLLLSTIKWAKGLGVSEWQ